MKIRAFLWLAAAVSAAAHAEPTSDPAEPVFRKVCGGCHDIGLTVARKHNREEWNVIVQQMLERGAPGTDEEVAAVLEYLVRQHGTEK